jgi:hypothetical protein
MIDDAKISEAMAVVTADDRNIGFVRRIERLSKLRITSLKSGCGGDHLIPLNWINDVGREVYLNKTSRFVANNWEKATVSPGCTPAKWPDGAPSPSLPVTDALP